MHRYGAEFGGQRGSSRPRLSPQPVRSDRALARIPRGADEMLALQRLIGNASAVRGRTIQRQTRSKYHLELLVTNTEPSKRPTVEQYLSTLKTSDPTLDDEDIVLMRRWALWWWSDKLKLPKPEQPTSQEPAEDPGQRDRFRAFGATNFASFAADVAAGYYTLTCSAEPKLSSDVADAQFNRNYSDGTTIRASITATIAGLSLDGDTETAFSRHDFQDSRSVVKNLQVQLGGSSGNFRKGKGKTSRTLVVFDTNLWNLMKRYAPNRLKAIIQEAHRQSFANKQRFVFGFGALR